MEPKYQVVISGMSGIFPESDDVEVLSENLYNKVDMVTTDDRRWLPGELGVPSGLGKINRQFFDYGFFGISSKLATIMDPTTKVTCEQAFRAVCDSGTSLKDLSGTNTAVFMSSFTSETEDLFLSDENQGNYGLLAHSRTMQANRISFFLHLKGPSVAVDATWGGGMEVLQRAYDSIAIGESVAAIVGSSSLIFAPQLSHHYQKMGRLSDDSITRSFSADANGYARSEGCVAFFLQRAEHAKRSYATILGINTLHFGAKLNPFTEFSEEGYKRLLKEAYSKAKVTPEELAYLEADGMASKKVDAQELNAVSEVLLPGRRTPLLIGSVKSNLGHAEAASSLISVVKALIAMEKGVIPPNLNFSSPNPDVPALVTGKLQVVTEPCPLEGDVIGISSIGVGGPYSHIVLKRNPKTKSHVLEAGRLPEDGLPRLVLLTDRSPENISENKRRLEEAPIDVEFVNLMNNFTKDGVRSYLYRGYTVLDGEPNKYNHIDAYSSGSGKRPIWFIFSGMGSQWPGMAKFLMQLPVFAKAIHTCHNTLLKKGLNLLDAVTNDDPKIFDNILNAFVGIAAVQIGLVDVLRSVGVEPDGIIGHSLGEQGCGYADGCFTTEQMILSAYARGKASLDADLIKGMMAAVGKGYQEMKDQLPENVEIACHNSKDSCTISGPVEEVAAFVEQLKQREIFAKAVNVGDIAFHSKYMKPAGELLVQYLGEVIPEPKRRTSRWVSSSNAESQWETDLAQFCSAEYHANNMLSPVLFEEASSHIPPDAIVIEIAPHALLQAILKRAIPTATHVPLTSRFDENGLKFLLSAIGKLYVAGVPVKPEVLYPPVEYPVARGTPFISKFIGWDHKEEFRYATAKGDVISCWKELEICLTDEEYLRLASHKLGGKFVIPDSFYIEHLVEMFTDFKKMSGSAVVIENLKFENAAEIHYHSIVDVMFKVQRSGGEFCINESGTEKMLVKGLIKILDPRGFNPRSCSVTLLNDESINYEIDGNNFYSLLKYQGVEVDGNFMSIKKIVVADDTIQAVIIWAGKLTEFLYNAFMLIGFFEARKTGELLFLKSANELMIDPASFINQPNREIFVEYNSRTRILQGKGLRMLLPQTRHLMLEVIQGSDDHLQCDLPQFVPYSNPKVQNFTQALELSTQIVLENAQLSEDGAIKVASIGCAFQNELSAITNSPKYHGKLELTSFESEEEFLEQDISSFHHDVFWIVSSTNLKPSTIQCAESSLECFFWVPAGGNGLNKNSMKEISSFIVNEATFALTFLNKPEEKKRFEEVIFGGNIDLLEQKLNSVNDLNESGDCGQSVVVLISKVESISSVMQIIDETKNVDNHHLLRYLFTDDSVLNIKSYSTQISKDLKVNIKLGGVWGTLRQLPVDLNEDMATDDVYSGIPVFLLSKVAPSGEFRALGLNLNDITGPVKDECLHVFDYASSKTMGLAVFDPVSETFTKDGIFEWKRPTTWSDTEAASVPMMYALASYIVHITNNATDGSSILVNRGLIPLSQALISISLSENIQTFVTVYGNEEKKTLLKMFPNLEERNIFDCSKSTFHIDVLMQTKGKGVHKVVNTFTEDLMIETCVKSVGILGTYVQVSTAPMVKDSKMGMLIFNKEVIALGATIDLVMGLPKEHKMQIRDLVQNALNSGHVKPFKNILSIPSQSSNAEAVCLLKDVKSKGVVDLKSNSKGNNSKTFVCDSISSYVVIGGQPQTESWLKVTEWLLRRGARRVNAVLKQPNLSAALSMRIQTLKESYPTSRIHLHSTKHISSKDNIEHFVNDIESAASLSTIFLLGSAVKDYSEPLHQVLQEKRIKCGLVCLGNGAERLCERWKKEGCTSLCVRCSPAVLDTCSFLQHLDELIINSKKNSVVTVNRYSLQHRQFQEKVGAEWDHVPASLPALHELLRLSSSKPTFVEVQSRTSRRDQTREIDPVFIIPGLRFNHARRIAERLYFPAFIARLPSNVVDIEFMASDLALQMSAMPQNMFTLIADEWGGTLALHIASKLQLLGKVPTVVLLDAAPATTRNWAAKLMSNDEVLLKKYIKLTPKAQLRLRQCSSWETKIDSILENSTDKSVMRKTLQGLSLLRNRLKGVLCDKPPARKIKFICNLYRYGQALKNDQCSLDEYLQKKAIIHVQEVDNMLGMIDQTVDEINSIVLFEYKDAAYRQEDSTIGIGFNSTTINTLPSLVCIHSFQT